MSLLTLTDHAKPPPDVPLYVSDSCCGTGRMLLEAAKVNSRVELVGQDVDPRCAKITAINMGLRSRYGWVICGNTLTNELHFAYRVGSFYHESPNGLRRGVIREVPIEQTSVKTITAAVQEAAREAIGEQAEDGPARFTLPTIIEVPRWLARLEPGLARRETSDSLSREKSSDLAAEQPLVSGHKQQTLF